MRKLIFIFLFACSLSFSACAVGGMNRTTTGALGGAGLGAGLGAIIGNQSGNPEAGVAIGSAAGAITGALLGNQLDGSDKANQQSRERIEAQQGVLEENRRMIEELRRRGADVTETSRGVVVNLPDVLFRFDSSNLTPQAQVTLDEVTDVIRTSGNREISVEGHTDSLGSVTYNKQLSMRRAETVARGIERRGISGQRIRSRGFGEGSPIASNNSDQGRARNRRVEIIIENQQRL